MSLFRRVCSVELEKWWEMLPSQCKNLPRQILCYFLSFTLFLVFFRANNLIFVVVARKYALISLSSWFWNFFISETWPCHIHRWINKWLVRQSMCRLCSVFDLSFFPIITGFIRSRDHRSMTHYILDESMPTQLMRYKHDLPLHFLCFWIVLLKINFKK